MVMEAIMSDLNFKDFLTSGCFLQVSPNLFKLMWGPFVKSSIRSTDDLGSNTFLFRPKFWDFLRQDQETHAVSVYLPNKSLTLNREEFIGFLSRQNPQPSAVKWGDIETEAFTRQYGWGQEKIASEEIKKIVPIIRQTGQGCYGIENRAFSLLNLLQSEGFGWSYGHFDQDEALIGKTPESLVVFNRSAEGFNSEAGSMALAGTFPNDEVGLQRINEDLKTRQEHDWVIADIKEKTLNYDTSVLPTEVLKLKHLLHLKTDFKFKVEDEFQVIDLANRLHPTAAMGTYPTNLKILKEFSKFELQSDREHFASPLGIVEKGLVHIVVAIRCLRVSRQQFIIDSGCGITAQSHFEDELKELENKRNSVKKMLGVFDDQF